MVIEWGFCIDRYVPWSSNSVTVFPAFNIDRLNCGIRKELLQLLFTCITKKKEEVVCVRKRPIVQWIDRFLLADRRLLPSIKVHLSLWSRWNGRRWLDLTPFPTFLLPWIIIPKSIYSATQPQPGYLHPLKLSIPICYSDFQNWLIHYSMIPAIN